MLAKALSKAGYKVVYVQRNWFFASGRTSSNVSGIELKNVNLLPYFRGRFGLIYLFNDFLMKCQLKKIRQRINGGVAYIVSSPNWTLALDKMHGSDQIFYDMSDDVVRFAKNSNWEKQLKKYENKLISISSKVVVSSKQLLNKAGQNAVLIENGVDIESFSKAKPIIERGKWKNIVGFIGGIYDWVDLGLIADAAKSYPDSLFVLVGPTSQGKELTRLVKLKNVCYLGEVSWQEVPDYFASLDIGLIPFVSEKKYPRLESVNSNKVYQYAYFGYPIVSTDFSQVRELDDLIFVSRTREEFIKAIGDAISGNNNDRSEKLKKFSFTNSWDSKAEAFSSLLDDKTI